MGKRCLLYGVGINDSDSPVNLGPRGASVRCKIYSAWKGILGRCYGKRIYSKNSSYTGCSVCVEWLTFSNFKSWMEKQDWEGKEVDKDLLVRGNKIYSPETCALVCNMTNSFINDRRHARGNLPIGVHWSTRDKRFISQCCNPFTKSGEYLGSFLCQEAAHETWRRRKHELACQVAELQADDRAAQALRLRYLPS